VGEMPPSLQVKLLRVLQEMEFERVGGTRTIEVDVRVLSASNRNIKEDVSNGAFREDLYYRLNVIHIDVPSLQERIDDIPLLVRHFYQKISRQRNRKENRVKPRGLEGLLLLSLARKCKRTGECHREGRGTPFGGNNHD